MLVAWFLFWKVIIIMIPRVETCKSCFWNAHFIYPDDILLTMPWFESYTWLWLCDTCESQDIHFAISNTLLQVSLLRSGKASCSGPQLWGSKTHFHQAYIIVYVIHTYNTYVHAYFPVFLLPISKRICLINLLTHPGTQESLIYPRKETTVFQGSWKISLEDQRSWKMIFSGRNRVWTVLSLFGSSYILSALGCYRLSFHWFP